MRQAVKPLPLGWALHIIAFPQGNWLIIEMETAQPQIIATQRQRRLRRAGLTGVATLLARGVTWLVSLLSLPLASHHLGKERFGLWLTLVGLVNWFSVADLGLTNSLINTLAGESVNAESHAAQRAVTSALGITFLAALLFVLLASASLPWFDWAVFFQLQQAAAQAEIKAALFVLMGCFALRLLAGVLSSVYAAYQEGYLYQLWTIACGLLSALGLWFAIRAQAGVASLLGYFLGGWLLGELVAALYLFLWHRPMLRPRRTAFDLAEAVRLLKAGFPFWVAQMSAVALLQTDLVVVAWLFGAQAVAGYGTAMRLFNLIGAAQTAFVAPLWAAYGEAAARRDYEWIAQTFRRSCWLSMAITLPAAGLVYGFAPWLFKHLVTADVSVTADLLLALFVVEVINALARCVAMLLNGLGVIRPQALYGPVAGAANLLLSVALARWFGASGVAWATALCLGVFWLGLLGMIAHRQLREWTEAH